MATLAAPPRRPGVSKRAEHLFYTFYMTALVAVIFAGFAPSFYLRGIAPSAAPLDELRAAMIVHGLMMSAFMLAFPVQAWLAGQRRLKAHVALGKAAFALGVVLLPVAYVTGAGSYHAARPGISDAMAVSFMVLPLFGVVTLGIGLWIAWAKRYEAQTHKRLMIAIACAMTDPAIFRMPIWVQGPEGLLFIQAVMLATLIPLWLWDLITLRRVHKGTLIGSGLFVGVVVLRTLAMPTAAWAAVVHALPLYGVR
jgi:hypothetical protein